MNIVLVAIAVFFINIPFGYWRADVIKFSLPWVMAIHIPVLIVIVLRIFTNLGFEFYTYPVLIAVFFFGQYLGSKTYIKRAALGLKPITSCLVMDVYRGYKS